MSGLNYIDSLDEIEESVWLPRSGKVSYISGSTIRQIN